MKPIFVLLALVFAAATSYAQEVVASSGNSGSAAGYTVDWTLGEPVIETIAGSGNILTQGMHQTNLLVTAVSEMEFPGLEVKVYPNPTGRFLKIEIIQTGNEPFFYETSDITGRKSVLKQMQTNTEEIDMGSFVSGIYFLNVVSQNHKIVKVFKIIKN
ncbi:T9SS type A sorting domain-containing protein [Mariniphaga sp.]|uniref:T9SS type A sorting domain-containing protein n=1 Tax=Mariniphaga sp. TaxID=1954475 RepID=UPI003568DC43